MGGGGGGGGGGVGRRHQHHHQGGGGGGLDEDIPQSYPRSLRNRKLRRLFHQSHQTKRLFTPEIKRYLKNWLVRRRKNPYPSRSEKKDLAVKTGLTYVQICNWFANWRRKLKNSSRGREITWGNLIKGYNVNARGNVEQFSISSDDSIWEDHFNIDSDDNSDKYERTTGMDHSYFSGSAGADGKVPHQDAVRWRSFSEEFNNNRGEGLLGRWLESAAKYRSQWAAVSRQGTATWPRPEAWQRSNDHWQTVSHPPHRSDHKSLLKYRHREELDAAEALTFLSNACA